MAFEITEFTKAKLQMECKIHFKDNSAQEVFDIMGNPELITEWYILAESVRMHPATAEQEASFNVVFTFFGDVYEEVLYWQPPLRYVYLAQGPNFPIKDYVAEIEVVADENKCGVMTWRLYYQNIEGENFKRIIPTLIPAMNKASMEKLSEFIGGYKVDCVIY